ncbi:MAG: DUF3107 domain-containing protein [Propionibacteriaceae bacterium]|jgi:hypothetical protein|nr:DUF3107 domain-containing protein [Propionibacteriaceae bacterium]
MEVKIGIRQIARETTVDVDLSVAQVTEAFSKARAEGDLLTLTDVSGHQILIPADGIGYIEFGQEHTRPVGFGSSH